MDKILVEVYIPASDETYDIMIPQHSKLFEVMYLLASTLSELTEGYELTTDTPVCNRKTGEILDINSTVKELGLINGSKLMLM